LINRKIGQPQQQQQQSQPSQQQQQQTSPKTASDANKQPSLAGVKRTSPNSNQNPSDIKKIKLLNPAKPIDETKPSKPAGTNTGNESPLKQNQQFINKNPKPTPTQTTNSSQQQQQSQQAQPKKISPASQPQQAPAKPQAQNVNKAPNKPADSEKSPKQQQQQQQIQPKPVNQTKSEAANTKTDAENLAKSKKIPSLFEVPVEPPPSLKNLTKPAQTNPPAKAKPVLSKPLTKPAAQKQDELANEAKKSINKTLAKPQVQQPKPSLAKKDESYSNDVDERFITNAKKLKIQDIAKQVDPSKGVASTSKLNESLQANSTSLNDLQEKLKASSEQDKANSNTTSTNTQELLDMIKKVLAQQQVLLDQRNSTKSPDQQTTSSSEKTVAQSQDEQYQGEMEDDRIG
jgi:hypothetical protein